MIWAIKNNERIRASPKETATCPLCNQEVISKCGKIKIWHFAHKQDLGCYEFEAETDRHIEMKLFFEKNLQGFEMEYNLGFAIPDLYNKERKIAIEVQHSKISKEKFIERTQNYKDNGIYVLWIFDCTLLKENKNVADFLREAHKIYFGRIYIYQGKIGDERCITPIHFEKKERKIIINTDYCEVTPEYIDEHGNEYIIGIYKLKRDFIFGNKITDFSLILTKNDWRDNDYLIAKFNDRRFW